MQQMEKLKNMVTQDKLRMSFELNEVTPANKELLSRIKRMDPYTIDWSNLPDYFSKEQFIAMARETSGAETVHNMHFMNWTNRVIGTFIGDYEGDDIPAIINETHSTWNKCHGLTLGIADRYRYNSRLNRMFFWFSDL